MKTRPIHALALLFAAALTLVAPVAFAEQMVDVGPYQIHYNVVPSGFLQPEVAERYDITRSRAIAVVNISVLKENEEGLPEPVPALVQGRVINDIRQDRPLSFRPVEEGEAIYYLAQLRFGEGQLLEYRATIRPQGHDRSYPIRFTKKLFNE